MAKKSTYQLKQLLPEEKPETGTKFIAINGVGTLEEVKERISNYFKKI